jgi:hypothetical protein
VAWGGEAGHVGAGLGEQVLGGGGADAGDLVELGDLGGQRGGGLLDPGGEGSDLGGERVDPGQLMPSMNAWWPVKWPVSASCKTLVLARMFRRARAASACGLRCPAMRASSMARPEAPKMSLITTDSLIWASSSSFSARCFSRVRSWVKVRR